MSLCHPGCPGSVDQARLELRDPPASVFPDSLELKVLMAVNHHEGLMVVRVDVLCDFNSFAVLRFVLLPNT